jgi:ATP-binding cassette subfamily A (ABC1) protein 2
MLEIHVDSPEDVDVVHQFVLNKLTRQAQLQENFGGRAVFALPKGHFKLPAAFKLISDAKQTLKLRDFSLSQTTLEQVFIAFAKKQVNAEN